MRQLILLAAGLAFSTAALADTVYLLDSKHPSGQSRAHKNTVVAAQNAPASDQLPGAQATWLQQQFASPLASYKLDQDKQGNTVYETELRDGAEVDVAADGQWRKIERRQGIAASLLPQPAQQYLKQHYPSRTIVQLERDEDGNIEVGLNRGTEIEFDGQGQWVKLK